MFGLGWSELLIILVIVVLLFGTSKIPQLGESLGKGIKNFQKAMKGESSSKDDEKDSEADSKKN